MVNRTALLAGLLVAGGALATPPPDTDLSSPVHQWFEKQTSHEGHRNCCSMADGHALEEADWRIKAGQYQVFVEDIWRDVPASAIVDPGNGANPVGKPVVWYRHQSGEPVIDCFVPGTFF